MAKKFVIEVGSFTKKKSALAYQHELKHDKIESKIRKEGSIYVVYVSKWNWQRWNNNY